MQDISNALQKIYFFVPLVVSTVVDSLMFTEKKGFCELRKFIKITVNGLDERSDLTEAVRRRLEE